MDIKDLAKRVKRGVRLLDKHIPNWRTVLRTHEDQFQFSVGDPCVLGALEHDAGRMQVRRERATRRIMSHDTFETARITLGLKTHTAAAQHGFDGLSTKGRFSYDDPQELPVLDALWRAEFEADNK